MKLPTVISIILSFIFTAGSQSFPDDVLTKDGKVVKMFKVRHIDAVVFANHLKRNFSGRAGISSSRRTGEIVVAGAPANVDSIGDKISAKDKNGGKIRIESALIIVETGGTGGESAVEKLKLEKIRDMTDRISVFSVAGPIEKITEIIKSDTVIKVILNSSSVVQESYETEINIERKTIGFKNVSENSRFSVTCFGIDAFVAESGANPVLELIPFVKILDANSNSMKKKILNNYFVRVDIEKRKTLMLKLEGGKDGKPGDEFANLFREGDREIMLIIGINDAEGE